MNFVLLSLTTLYIAYRLPLAFWRIFSFFGIFLVIGLLIATVFVGKNLNEAQRWINILGFKFQPSEFAKVGTVLYLSLVLETIKFDSYKKFVIWVVAPIALVILLILNGSIATGLLMTFVVFIMLLVTGIKWSYLLKTAGIGAILLGLVLLLNIAFGLFPRVDTAVSRIKNFTNKQEPTEKLAPAEKQRILDKTYQADMARIAISSVGIFGKGPGKSTQRNFLPHPYSDFIYAIIIEEWGFLGGLVVLMLYLWFFARSVMIAKSCKTIFSSMAVLGLSTLITTQAFLHILVNVGILPVTGHTLPLISRGGTSLLATGAAFGIIQAVSRTIDKVKVKGEVEL